jgi:hypothetical protein
VPAVKEKFSMLKYYIYISETKVNMLYPQIPAAFLSAAESEVKVSLGVVSTSLKSRGPEQAKELAGRVGVVAGYLRKHEKVGTPAEPQTWFQAEADLRWGVVREYASDIAFFGGRVGSRMLALLGSSESIVGAAQTSEAQHAPYYYTLRFMNGIVEGQADLGRAKMPYYSWPQAVEIANAALVGSMTRLEFLARLVHQEGDLVVGTPIYVALT